MFRDPQHSRAGRIRLYVIGGIIGTIVLATWVAQIMIWLRPS
jgi:hypothetical protein